MKSNNKQLVIPVFIPHLGCPNDCSFCNQKSISGKSKMPTKEEVIKIIESYLKSIKDEKTYIEIAFFRWKFYRNRRRKTKRVSGNCKCVHKR